MNQSDEALWRFEAPTIPDDLDLPADDGEPLESDWHRSQINLLIDTVCTRWADRQDFFAGGNMFIYYSLRQARDRDFRGPDFFVVKEVDRAVPRDKWVVWEEEGRYPNMIMELMSPSTAEMDLTVKKVLYERTFLTTDYFAFDPIEQQLVGWHLGEDRRYHPLQPDENGRLWSGELDAWIGLAQGVFLGREDMWLRLFDADGNLLPTEAEAERERAEIAQQRAEAQSRRAERLAAQLRALGIEPAGNDDE